MEISYTLPTKTGKKLDPHYVGPYKVIDVQEQNCKLEELSTRKTSVVHKNRIIKM